MEKPNLIYLDSIACGDNDVKNLLIDTIKLEFPEEANDYYESFMKKDYKKSEFNVHRIKHKISILGLEQSYLIANEYEQNLRIKSTYKSDDFDTILLVITEYLKTL
jgi:hypothetical protein|tara:strand:+ start:4454 stop:4771 length:318 start_codon:yes stop_codon:yes gene_type:complete